MELVRQCDSVVNSRLLGCESKSYHETYTLLLPDGLSGLVISSNHVFTSNAKLCSQAILIFPQICSGCRCTCLPVRSSSWLR